jgi:hypothetical protein
VGGGGGVGVMCVLDGGSPGPAPRGTDVPDMQWRQTDPPRHVAPTGPPCSGDKQTPPPPFPRIAPRHRPTMASPDRTLTALGLVAEACQTDARVECRLRATCAALRAAARGVAITDPCTPVAVGQVAAFAASFPRAATLPVLCPPSLIAQHAAGDVAGAPASAPGAVETSRRPQRAAALANRLIAALPASEAPVQLQAGLNGAPAPLRLPAAAHSLLVGALASLSRLRVVTSHWNGSLLGRWVEACLPWPLIAALPPTVEELRGVWASHLTAHAFRPGPSVREADVRDHTSVAASMGLPPLFTIRAPSGGPVSADAAARIRANLHHLPRLHTLLVNVAVRRRAPWVGGLVC